MAVTTYLLFNGNCAEAMRFYERALGGKLEALLTYGENPGGQLPPNVGPDKIMHARLLAAGGAIMASDDMSGAPHKGMHGFSVAVEYPTAEESRRAFEALKDGGTVVAPMTKTFWSEAFGMLVDRFGTPWMISTETKA